MTFLPDPATFAAYALACLVLALTPGPDMSLALARTLSAGRGAGFATVFGTTIGSLGHTLAAALGLSALLAASATAFTVLKIAGALYLAWLAFDALRRGSALSVRGEGGKRLSPWRSFLLGVSVNLTNPKVVLFYVTFLPQFVVAGDPHAVGKFLFLGLFLNLVVGLPFGLALVLGAGRVVGALRARPRLLRALDWLFAGLFGAFAARILATQGR